MQVVVTTAPFGDPDPRPRKCLEEAGVKYSVNPFGRKLSEDELKDMLEDAEVVIAGTERISRETIEGANRLKLICRVGIGLDSVDLSAAREKGIMVTYTPEAPSAAVAELTVGLMINLLRSIHISNNELHHGAWERYFGTRLGSSVVGIIGAGRIGTRVLKHLSGFECRGLLVNDLILDDSLRDSLSFEYAEKEEIYRSADLISLHLPLTSATRNLIDREELSMMKRSAFLINTSRGGIINEASLVEALRKGCLAGAAIDTFEQEPYDGPFSQMPNCLLTAHMGSMAYDCRVRMEIEATEEAVRFLRGERLSQPVPESEYQNQAVQ